MVPVAAGLGQCDPGRVSGAVLSSQGDVLELELFSGTSTLLLGEGQQGAAHPWAPCTLQLPEGTLERAGGSMAGANVPGGERGKAAGWFGGICYSSCTRLSLTPVLEAGAGEQESPSLTLQLLCLGGPAVMGGGVGWREQSS